MLNKKILSRINTCLYVDPYFKNTNVNMCKCLIQTFDLHIYICNFCSFRCYSCYKFICWKKITLSTTKRLRFSSKSRTYTIATENGTRQHLAAHLTLLCLVCVKKKTWYLFRSKYFIRYSNERK